jgi:hypothetical protein
MAWMEERLNYNGTSIQIVMAFFKTRRIVISWMQKKPKKKVGQKCDGAAFP